MEMLLFHRHVDACAHCADHPFALCLEGLRLLAAASAVPAPPPDRVLCFPSFQTLDPPPTAGPDDHEAGMQYLIYDPRSRCWLTDDGDWSTNLLHARKFVDYHTAAALRVTLPFAFALYVTEGHAPEQP